MKDYYSILGVSKTASEDEIKRAYRKKAMKHHPDRGGDQAQFQDINEAYSVLSDPARRSQYDNPQPENIFANFGDANGFDFDTVFNMFGARFNHDRARHNTRIMLWISLRDVAMGGPRLVNTGMNNVEIEIPLGIEDGDSVRYSKLGPSGSDLVVVFRIKQQPRWQRNRNDVIHDVDIDLWTAIIGGNVDVVTLTGKQIAVAVPPRTRPSSMLRLRNHGLPDKSNNNFLGDMYLRCNVVMPDHIPEDLIEHIKRVKGD